MFTDLKTILNTVAPRLFEFGLLSEDDWNRAAELHQQATQYQAAARNAESIVASKLADVANKLAADPKASPDTVYANALKIPDPGNVAAIASQIERTLTSRARELIVARAREVVPLANAAFIDIAAETADVAAALGSVDSPQGAIDAGLTEPWRRGGELQAEYSDLRAFLGVLAELKLIPSPRDRDRGAWWQWRLDADPQDWLPTDASRFKSFARDMRRGPWYPTSIPEAEAVFAEWQRAAVTA